MSIWDFKEIKKNIDADHLLTLGEGNTLLQEINDEFGNSVFIKREIKNPTGSWKDRGTAYLLTLLNQKGVKDIVISSSGNAAISLAKYAQLTSEIGIHIVISPSIAEAKLSNLQELEREYKNIRVYQDSHTKKKRAELVSQLKAFLWSSSSNDDILPGYWSLGFELSKVIKGDMQKEHYVIAPISSGAAFIGMTQGIHQKFEQEHLLPHMIACQTQSCHPLLDEPIVEEKSLADAIVDQTLLRKMQIQKILKTTEGKAFSITNDEIIQAKEWSESHGIKELSNTSLLSIAAYLKLREGKQSTNFYCIASGR